MLDSVTTFFVRLAQLRPLVLVIDDVHWADDSSVALLGFAARTLHDARLGVVATYRPEERSTALVELTESGTRSVDQLSLGGLDATAVGALVPTGADVTAMVERTGGNPFFIQQLGLLDDDVVPDNVRGVLQRRLSGLPPDVTELLHVLALAGGEPPRALLHAVLPEVGVDRVLADAARAGIVDHGAARFVHALFRETVLHTIGTSERQRLHTAIADALEASGAVVSAAEVAHHARAAALAGGDRGRAAAWCERAGTEAMRQLAYVEAAQQFTDTLELTEPSEHGRRARLLLALAETKALAGDLDGAKVTFLVAANAARAIGEPLLLARAAIGLSQREGRPGVSWGFGDRDAVALLEESLGALPSDQDATRAQLLAELASEQLYARWGDHISAATAAADALSLARRAGDAATLIDALIIAAASSLHSWRDDRARELLAEAIELADLAGDGHASVSARVLRSYAATEVVDFAAADRDQREAHRIADELGVASLQWHWPTYLAMRALFAGRFDEANRHASSVLEFASRSGHRYALQHAMVILSFSARDRGVPMDPDQLEAFGVHVAPFTATDVAVALALAETGRIDEAKVRLREVLGTAGTALVPDSNYPAAWLLAAMAASATGDRETAEHLYSRGTDLAGRLVRLGIGACGGPADYGLGLLAATIGRWDDAEAHLNAAIVLSEHLGAAPSAVRAQLALAPVLVDGSHPNRDQGCELARAALVTATQLGMVAAEAEARTLLDRI